MASLKRVPSRLSTECKFPNGLHQYGETRLWCPYARAQAPEDRRAGGPRRPLTSSRRGEEGARRLASRRGDPTIGPAARAPPRPPLNRDEQRAGARPRAARPPSESVTQSRSYRDLPFGSFPDSVDAASGKLGAPGGGLTRAAALREPDPGRTSA